MGPPASSYANATVPAVELTCSDRLNEVRLGLRGAVSVVGGDLDPQPASRHLPEAIDECLWTVRLVVVVYLVDGGDLQDERVSTAFVHARACREQSDHGRGRQEQRPAGVLAATPLGVAGVAQIF